MYTSIPNDICVCQPHSNIIRRYRFWDKIGSLIFGLGILGAIVVGFMIYIYIQKNVTPNFLLITLAVLFLVSGILLLLYASRFRKRYKLEKKPEYVDRFKYSFEDGIEMIEEDDDFD